MLKRTLNDLFSGEINLKDCVVKRKDGYLQLVYYTELYEKKYVYGKTIAEIEDKLKRIRNTNKYFNLDYNAKMDDLFIVFLNIRLVPKLKPQTINKNLSLYIHNIQPILGRLKVINIDYMFIQNYINKLSNDGKTIEMIKRILNILKRMFDFAIVVGIITMNPTNRVIVLDDIDDDIVEKQYDDLFNSTEKISKDKYLDQNERIHLMELVHGTQMEFPVAVALYTGMRPGEIAALRRSDLDFENMIINVRSTLSVYYYEKDDTNVRLLTPAKTHNSFRSIPIHRNIYKMLKNAKPHKFTVLAGTKVTNLRYTTFDDFITVSATGSLFSVSGMDASLKSLYYQDYKNRCRLAFIQGKEIPEFKYYTMHNLRATAATLMFKNKMELVDVQNILGHSDPKTTLKYYIQKDEKTSRSIIDNIELL